MEGSGGKRRCVQFDRMDRPIARHTFVTNAAPRRACAIFALRRGDNEHMGRDDEGNGRGRRAKWTYGAVELVTCGSRDPVWLLFW